MDVSDATLTYTLSGLTPGTDYTYHAFAAVSNDTVLGNEVTFTTNPEILTRLDTLTGPYEAQDGDILVGTLASPYKITIAPSATVTLRDATISPSGTASTGTTNEYAGITCDGNATILLEGTNTVKGFNTNYPGIYVAPNMTLTIEGTGSLSAKSDGYGAGIGGGNNIPCGSIVINSGTITAQGGSFAAGIGSGQNSTCENITIIGGTVNATGGNYGAGIGTGAAYTNGYPNTCGDITISGGTVTAKGSSQFAAGIGNGLCNRNSPNTCGNITISGGTVIAEGAKYGAGIGNAGSNWSTAASTVCGNISITGGTVVATGGESATGIGNGKRYLASGYTNIPPSICGDITIGTGVTTVTATKGPAGSGTYNVAADYCIGRSKSTNTCGTVTIGGEDKTPGVSPTSGNTYVYEP